MNKIRLVDTIHDKILSEGKFDEIKPVDNDNDNNNNKNNIKITKTSTTSKLYSRFKSKIKRKNESSDEDTEEFEEQSQDQIEGINSKNYNRKKVKYYRGIKRKNRKKAENENKRKRTETLVKFILYIFSNCINVLAVLNYILETYFENLGDVTSKNISSVLAILEVSFSFYFLFEYLLLFTRIQRNLINHIFSWDSLIDVITIVPSIVSYFISNIGVKLSFVRVFRIFRVFRILRIYKSLKMIQYEAIGMDEQDSIAESPQHLRFDPIKLQFFSILVIVVCLFFIGAGLVLGLQDLIQNAFSRSNLNFFDALYFMIVTYSTLGYGDITPTHIVSRMFVIVGLFCLIVIISDRLTKLANLLAIWGPGWRVYKKKHHIVAICDDTINLESFLKTIKLKNYEREVIIISKEIEKIPRSIYPFIKVHLVKTNSYDFETFERANMKSSKAIFIFSNKSLNKCDQKEKITDFLLLKINRFYNNIPVYVQTLYSERSFSGGKGIGFRSNPKNKMLKFKKIIPIMRIKSLIISKSMFNPGFATFIQNLMFNEYPAPVDLDVYSSIMSSYLLGCENKIYVKKFPPFFENKEFFDVCHMIYFKSIRDYFVKISSLDNINENRPVLLIGIFDRTKEKVYDKEKISIFPSRITIKDNMLGIFISYDDGKYLDSILGSFHERKRGQTIKMKEEINELQKSVKVSI